MVAAVVVMGRRRGNRGDAGQRNASGVASGGNNDNDTNAGASVLAEDSRGTGSDKRGWISEWERFWAWRLSS